MAVIHAAGNAWKKRALRLLAANKAAHGRLRVAEVARRVKRSRQSVYLLLAEMREAHAELASG